MQYVLYTFALLFLVIQGWTYKYSGETRNNEKF